MEDLDQLHSHGTIRRIPLSSNLQTTDVAIIGAGPVGLFAVFECGMLKMRCRVIDSLEVIGGQCADALSGKADL